MSAAVCLFVKNAPVNFATVRQVWFRLGKVIILPGDAAVFFYLRVLFYKRAVSSINFCVSFKILCDWHVFILSLIILKFFSNYKENRDDC